MMSLPFLFFFPLVSHQPVTQDEREDIFDLMIVVLFLLRQRNLTIEFKLARKTNNHLFRANTIVARQFMPIYILVCSC